MSKEWLNCMQTGDAFVSSDPFTDGDQKAPPPPYESVVMGDAVISLAFLCKDLANLDEVLPLRSYRLRSEEELFVLTCNTPNFI